MNLTRASALATFAVIHLAEAGSRRIQGREVAAALETPADYLLKILQQLVRARILSSVRGPSGGFELARNPQAITLLDIVEAIDGPLDGEAVMPAIPGKHRAKTGIALACSESAGFARALLGRTTIYDLADATSSRAKTS